MEQIVLASVVKDGELWKELQKEMRKNPQLRVSMKAAKSYYKKEEVRKEWWGCLRVVETTKELESIETYSTEDYSKAVWHTLMRIAWEIGGDLEGAKNYCQSCVE